MQKSKIVMSCLAVVMLSTAVFSEDRAPRTDKVQGVSFHDVSTVAASGYNQATLDGQSYFVASKAMILADQVSSVQSNASSLTLNGDFAGSNKANKMGVLIDGQLVAVGSLALQNGQATITGLSSSQTQRITHLLSRKTVSPTGAAYSVVSTGQANGEYMFEVFVQNVPELRTYQVKLEVTGGTAGSLTMTDVRIDESRPDYVFAGNEAVKAADHGGSRLGGTLFNGSVAVAAPKYVGSWRYRPSSDAAGTFKINVITGAESFIANVQNQNLPVAAVGATVQIGSKSRLSE